MNRTYAYLRVSTIQQELETQRLEITRYATQLGLQIDDWVTSELSSRKRLDQRGIPALIGRLKKGDRIIVSELSRLARSIREIHNVIYSISKRKAELHVIKQGIVLRDSDDMAGKIYVNAFAMAAEIERDLISQRTKSGLARVKASGRKLGNPNLVADNSKKMAAANEWAEKLRGTVFPFVQYGYTQRRIVQELNGIGAKTYAGREFKLVTVQRLLKRLHLTTAPGNATD
jgi:putative DNA-invertase from lambdoid prophage Rac